MEEDWITDEVGDDQDSEWITDVPEVDNRPRVSEMGAFGEGALQGASMGLSDEIGAGIEAAGSWLGGQTYGLFHPEQKVQGPEYSQLYDVGVKQRREDYQQAKEQHPGVFEAGEYTGMGASMLVPTGGATRFLGKGLIKGAGWAGRGARAGKGWADDLVKAAGEGLERKLAPAGSNIITSTLIPKSTGDVLTMLVGGGAGGPMGAGYAMMGKRGISPVGKFVKDLAGKWKDKLTTRGVKEVGEKVLTDKQLAAIAKAPLFKTKGGLKSEVLPYGTKASVKITPSFKTRTKKTLKKFTPLLEEAAIRGPAALASEHMRLSEQNSEYREAMEQAEKEMQGSDNDWVADSVDSDWVTE